MARAPTTADVFNAIAEADRREILDVLIAGEKPVGMIVDELAISQPQVSRHLRVLSEVGLVSCRAQGRRRLYRLNPTGLQPVGDWVARFEHVFSKQLDRLDDYLTEVQRHEGDPPKRPRGAA